MTRDRKAMPENPGSMLDRDYQETATLALVVGEKSATQVAGEIADFNSQNSFSPIALRVALNGVWRLR